MSQLPAHLQKYQAPDVGAALSANLGSTMPPHVSIGGGRFTLIDASNNEIPVPTFDPKEGVYLEACIVDVNPVMSRIYFSGAYDNDAEGVRPDCFSDNGIAPSISAGSPQALTCQPDPTGVHGCKWAVWGSKINANGKKVPACSSKQKVALLIPGFNTLFLLAIPPNSHPLLREYVEKCKGNGINMADVITRITFVPGVQGTLQFRGISYIDEPTAVLRQAAYLEKKTDALVGRNDVPRTVGAIAAPAQQAQIPFVQTAMPGAQTGIGAGSATQPATSAASQQVQQPGPFGTTPAATAAAPGAETQNAAPTAGMTSPSEGAPTTRRRRRTAAEMQAANGTAPAGEGFPGGQAAPQAPFPHAAASQTATAGPAAGNPQTAPAGSFGIAQGQDAAANPELTTMLDDFFKG